MRQDALESLSDNGSGSIADLVAKRAAKSGIYSTDDPRNRQSHKQPRKVDADCGYCHGRPVINLDDCGYFCTKCEKKQPIEWTKCVFCDLKSAVKRIDSHTCILCKKDQPTESKMGKRESLMRKETGLDRKEKDKQEESILVCQRWEVMDRFRQVELNALCSLHLSVEGKERFEKLYWGNMPEERPDSYYSPQRKSQNPDDRYKREEPFECCVDPETFKRVRNSSCGVWVWANPHTGTVINILDQEQIISMDEAVAP